jgi:hypothetical protein
MISQETRSYELNIKKEIENSIPLQERVSEIKHKACGEVGAQKWKS